jgi:hypothetical protein
MSVGEFVHHCDDECGLGRFVYVCPACLRTCDDYQDVWYGRENIYGGEPVQFSCERCQAKLLAHWDRDEGEVQVYVMGTPERQTVPVGQVCRLGDCCRGVRASTIRVSVGCHLTGMNIMTDAFEEWVVVKADLGQVEQSLVRRVK